MKLSEINMYDFGNEIQIAGVVWEGKGKVFVTPPPLQTVDLSHAELMPLTLEEWEKLLYQADRQEVEIFQREPSGITKIILRKTQRTIDSYMQWACFQRDSYSCRYCGKTGIPLTVDHVDLWEDGGVTIVANLLSCCRKCNKIRGRMQYEDWLNSKEYKERSVNLTPAQLQENSAVLDLLPEIRSKRVQNIRTR